MLPCSSLYNSILPIIAKTSHNRKADMMPYLNWKVALLILLASFCCRSVAAQKSLTSEQFTADFDAMWAGLRDGYAYFHTKETDWNRVRELYLPQVAAVKSERDFIPLLERMLEELYDPHSNLNTNLGTSPRLVPTGLDLWAEWIKGRAVITQLRTGFSAEQAGLKVGMEIVSINGVPIQAAVVR